MRGVGLLVDSKAGVQRASDAAARAGTSLDLYVEVDVGANRCGVSPESGGRTRSADRRAAAVCDSRVCTAITGRHSTCARPKRARPRSLPPQAKASKRSARSKRADWPVPIVTGAGTGTWTLERDSGVWNELQPGSYVFMDADYARNAQRAA